MLFLYTVWFSITRGIKVGGGSIIHPGARVSKLGGGSITIGRNCILHSGSLLATYGGSIRLGDNVTVNDYSILYGHGGLEIGDGVRIAAHVVIIPANHGIEPDRAIHVQPMNAVGIRIGTDVWIGAGVRILDGSDVANGCVLAAGAVVLATLETEAMGIYGGVPARKISSRYNLGPD